jgi:hypothetical protein
MSDLVCARDLAVGDLMLGGQTVLAVRRDDAAGCVTFAADDGTVKDLPADARVVVLARDPGAAPVEPPLSPRERFLARSRLDAQASR